jgi:hypothetical protein
MLINNDKNNIIHSRFSLRQINDVTFELFSSLDTSKPNFVAQHVD